MAVSGAEEPTASAAFPRRRYGFHMINAVCGFACGPAPTCGFQRRVSKRHRRDGQDLLPKVTIISVTCAHRQNALFTCLVVQRPIAPIRKGDTPMTTSRSIDTGIFSSGAPLRARFTLSLSFGRIPSGATSAIGHRQRRRWSTDTGGLHAGNHHSNHTYAVLPA